MMRTKFTVLLSIIVMMFFPWQMMCMEHPTGHTHHHESGELSACEQRRLCNETSFWPPMDCHKLTIQADDYRLPQNEPLTLKVQAVAILPLELINIVLPEENFQPLPDPFGNSDPPPGANLLRGPPFA